MIAWKLMNNITFAFARRCEAFLVLWSNEKEFSSTVNQHHDPSRMLRGNGRHNYFDRHSGRHVQVFVVSVKPWSDPSDFRNPGHSLRILCWGHVMGRLRWFSLGPLRAEPAQNVDFLISLLVFDLAPLSPHPKVLGPGLRFSYLTHATRPRSLLPRALFAHTSDRCWKRR